MQGVNKKAATQRLHRNPARSSRPVFTSPHVTIQIPKECLDGLMLQEMHHAMWCAAQRIRERGEPEKRARVLESAAEGLERLEAIVNGNIALHDGEIVASEIPDQA